MQTDWLIDFMTLAQTRSFSRSAQLRHVTQPAFSRRIRALEAWARASLVDRGRHPLCLTQAGQLLHAQAPEIVASIRDIHAQLRAHAPEDQEVLEFAAHHALQHFFPDWLCGLGTALAGTKTRLTTLDQQDALRHLCDGVCDLLLVYECADLPLGQGAERCERLHLETERLVPCTRPNASGQPLYPLFTPTHDPLPYLAHSAQSGLGRVVEHALSRQGGNVKLHRVFESDTVESLKAMALAGHGIAFLPERSVRPELARAQLLPASTSFHVTLDISILRTRAQRSGHGKHPLGRFWHHLIDLHGVATRVAPRSPRADTNPCEPELVG